MSKIIINTCDKCSNADALHVVEQYMKGNRAMQNGSTTGIVLNAGNMYKVTELDQTGSGICDGDFSVEKLERVL